MCRYVCVLLMFVVSPFIAITQTITTFAGTGVHANTGDGGIATMAAINYPTGLAFDKSGNLYIALGASGNGVRKISPSGIITTIAGTGISGYSGDGGPATNAQLNNPQYIALDTSGNIYITEAQNNVVRRIDAATGIITTFAGNGTAGFGGDGGPATAAMLYDPLGICADKFGNIYVGDHVNARVRKINSAGVISTFAGNGIVGYSGNNGLATASSIFGAFGLCVDDTGNVYIADGYSRVCKVNGSGVIATFAGSNIPGSIGDEGVATAARINPISIVFDKFGNFFIAENAPYNKVRVIDPAGIIHTAAGNGASTFGGDGGPATAASIYYPSGVAVDSCGNLFISDLNSRRIRRVAFNPECWAVDVKEVMPENLSIYPNPTNNELHIEAVESNKEYSIRGIMGAAMLQGVLKKGRNVIDVRGLPVGMYMVEVNDKKGRRILAKILRQ